MINHVNSFNEAHLKILHLENFHGYLTMKDLARIQC